MAKMIESMEQLLRGDAPAATIIVPRSGHCGRRGCPARGGRVLTDLTRWWKQATLRNSLSYPPVSTGYSRSLISKAFRSCGRLWIAVD